MATYTDFYSNLFKLKSRWVWDDPCNIYFSRLKKTLPSEKTDVLDDFSSKKKKKKDFPSYILGLNSEYYW
jgi:hypothetical protein